MVYFTKSGFTKIKLELESLQKRRPGVVDELQRARELGDLSENGAYKAARHELSTIDRRIRRIERQLEKAQILIPKTDGTIGVGNTVILKSDNQEFTYEIVGDFEADPGKKKISSNSPLGKNLMGKKAGEKIKVETPTSSIKYIILSVQ